MEIGGQDIGFRVKNKLESAKLALYVVGSFWPDYVAEHLSKPVDGKQIGTNVTNADKLPEDVHEVFIDKNIKTHQQTEELGIVGRTKNKTFWFFFHDPHPISLDNCAAHDDFHMCFVVGDYDKNRTLQRMMNNIQVALEDLAPWVTGFSGRLEWSVPLQTNLCTREWHACIARTRPSSSLLRP